MKKSYQTLSVLIIGLMSAPRSTAETCSEANIAPDGRLHLLTENGQIIVPQMKKDQVGYQMAAVSPDRRAVGWLSLSANCCTSYPIPSKLVIRSGGTERSFTGKALPIWRWHFLNGGKQVAFEQETVHGGMGVHYELRDVASGKLLAAYDPDSDVEATPPLWVELLNEYR